MPAVDRIPRDQRRRTAGVRVGAGLVASLLALVLGSLLFATAPAEAQVVRTTPAVDQSVPSTSDPSSDGGEAQPETVASRVEPVAAESPPRRWLTEDRKIFIVVFGLIFVALALSALTFRYWRVTKPIQPVVTERTPKHAAGQRSAQVEPADRTGDGPDGDATRAVPETGLPTPPVKPAEPAPLPAFPKVDLAGLPKLGLAGFAPLTLGGNDSSGSAGEERSSRQAVAGADHRTVGADWEPRGTGEHDRVEIPAVRTARPSRAGRRAALERRTGE